jgi:hypothetical protein
MNWFKRFKRKCPDGTIHWVYRNINDAFPLIVADVDTSFNGKVNVDGVAQTELGTKYASKIKGLLFELDSANQNIMIEFRAVYSVYQSEPCGNAKFFSTKIAEIIEDHKNLRQLKTKIEGLVSILGANSISEKGFVDAFLNITNGYGKYVPNQAAQAKIYEMTEVSKDWQNPKRGHDNEDN